MSLKTWCEEFYPIPAFAVQEPQALDHSIQKWEGLRQKNLKRHNVTLRRDGIDLVVYDSEDDDGVMVNDRTCALCVNYRWCNGCPVLNTNPHGCDSAFQEFSGTCCPESMLKLLYKVKELQT